MIEGSKYSGDSKLWVHIINAGYSKRAGFNEGISTYHPRSGGARAPLFFHRDCHSPATTAIQKRPINARGRVLGRIARVTTVSPDAV